MYHFNLNKLGFSTQQNVDETNFKKDNVENNGVKTKKKKSKRIFYFDALRALAILAVILIHVASRMKLSICGYYSPQLNFHWLFGDFFYAGMAIGVDIFLMLSGALSLGREWSIRSFLGKRIPRIAAPFLFWGFVLCMIVVILQYQFPEFIHVLDVLNAKEIFHFVIGAYRAKSFGFEPYWFFWMILGTYLIMPIFNKWLLHSDLKEAEYFLAIWLISCIFDATINYPFPIKISYFTSPIGFVVLGYYLRHTKRKIFNNKYIPIILIIIGLSCLLYGSFLYSTPHKLFKFDRYSIFNAILVTGVFLLFRSFSDVNFGVLSRPNGIVQKSIFSIAKYSYGFYLLHQVIMNLVIHALRYFNLYHGYVSLFFIIFVATLAISWFLMAVLNRIPYVNQVIGAK